MSEVALRELTKRYADQTVVDHVSMTVADGEMVVLVGPSGCGKTTTLRMVAGLERVSGGEIWIGDRLVNNVSPTGRNVAMVFQNFALYPHMTVFENIGFPLDVAGVSRKEINSRVTDVAQLLRVDRYLKRMPRQLSGGQQQRVALGRAIIRKPAALLMDEPLSNLDAQLRVEMRAELKKLRKRLATTVLYVTHDQTEAMTMGDRIAAMKSGVVQQIDTPDAIFRRPANVFVAGLIGSPAMNFFDADLVSASGSLTFVRDDIRIALPASKAGQLQNDGDGTRQFRLGIRPEHLAIYRGDAQGMAKLGGFTCVIREPLGSEVLYQVEHAGVQLTVREQGDMRVDEGATVDLAINLDSLHVFEGDSGNRV